MMPRLRLALRIMMAMAISSLAYSGYFTGTRMRSSSGFSSLRATSLSRRMMRWADHSVTMDEMTQVKRIMMTTPLSMLSSTRGCPCASFRLMPTRTMAMAPAAWADVRPNIMCPDEMGNRNKVQARWAATALPKVPKTTMQSTTQMMLPPAKSSRRLMSMPTPMRK